MSEPRRGVLPPGIIGINRNPWTEPFWQAASAHRLVVPRCGACGRHRMPPSPFCPRCRSQAVEWREHDGRGELYSYTVIRHAVIPDVRDALPLIAAVVELHDADHVRLVGNLLDVEPEDVRIGSPVALSWYDVRDGDAVPCFHPLH